MRFHHHIIDAVQVVEEGGAGMANVSKTLALDKLGKRLPFGSTHKPCLVHCLGSLSWFTVLVSSKHSVVVHSLASTANKCGKATFDLD